MAAHSHVKSFNAARNRLSHSDGQYRCLAATPSDARAESLFGQCDQEIGFWCSQQLSEVDKAFVNTFQPTITWQLSETKTLLAYHGSPRSFRE